MQLSTKDTICAIATGKGGALGIIRVSGPKAIDITNSIFRGKTTLKEVPTHTIHYGKILDSDHSIIDDALVSVFRAPHSYTGEESTELSLHNSPYILRKTLSRLIEAGARLANPGEYTQRAFLNHKMDLAQAEAVADLISAQSRAAHDIALSQMRGGVSAKLKSLRGQLLRIATLLELELDFSEEDVEFADREQLLALTNESTDEIRRLLSTYADGNALKQGVPVAIVGAPNVGKSTLLNTLLGDDKAIVSPEAGTTRDLVEDTVQIGGILFRIIDTAGLRHTASHVERQGIDRALKAAQQARIVLMMTEPGVPYPDIPTRQGQTVIHILNKTPQFQALNGVGLSQLKQQMVDCLPQVNQNSVLLTNQRHQSLLKQSLAALTRVEEGLGKGLTPDLLAEDLRLALNTLGEIMGEVTSEDILHSVFSHFCIGK